MSNDTINITDTITLDSGRELKLKKITQFYTYGGVMEGNPVSINWNVTQRAIENCQGSKQPILLVPDTHQYLLSEEAYMEARDDDKYVQRWRLPEVCSIATFTSTPCDPDADGGDWSMNGIIWFQDAFGFELNPFNTAKMKAINWEAGSIECGY
jgi:hypothetical protein